ncbi:GvpL/GvpF family gas vesicle protein [Microbispora bryophytorum]|uniref:GvpL/GvpF family gas vesicle protein n=1 Tax=Microbispora bryophytorum TaxID=1460882 RepID=UPI0033C88C15
MNDNHPAVSENHPAAGESRLTVSENHASVSENHPAAGGSRLAAPTVPPRKAQGPHTPDDPRATPETVAPGGPGQGVYLYAVTPGGELPRDLRGVMDGPVRTVSCGGLVAHVSDVPLDRFGEEPLRRSLEDLEWVEGVARAHHRVVETLAAAGPAAPVRLVTVYTGEEQVRDLLDRRHDDFAEILSHVAGRREWGVKAYLRRETPPPSPTPASPTPAAATTTASAGASGGDSPGLAYLRRKKESLRGREDLWRAAAERAELLHAELGQVAVASRRHRPQDPQLSGRSESMVLNGAYLVDPAREEEFAAVLGGYRDRFLDVELTGPWAPYSFTSIDLGTGRAGGPR